MALLQDTPVTILQPRNTIYDKMVFKDYEFAEFPMAIPVVDGQIMPTPYNEKHKAHPVVIVHSQAELDALRGPEVTLVPVSEAGGTALRVEGEDDIRAALYTQAKQASVKIDKTWSVARIEDALRQAAEDKAVV